MELKKYKSLMKKYGERYGSFILAYHARPKSKWNYVNYGTKEWKDAIKFEEYPNHRYIFPDELVIDIDTDDLSLNIETSRQVIENLNKHKFKYSLWTPYDKHHFHIFFSVFSVYSVGCIIRGLYLEIFRSSGADFRTSIHGRSFIVRVNSSRFFVDRCKFSIISA